MGTWVAARRVRELTSLLGESWEIAGSGGEATQHAARGILRFIGADAGGFVLAPGSSVEPGGNMIKACLVGFAPPDEREVGAFYQRLGGTAIDGAATALVKADPQATGLCRRRRELVGDRDWYGSEFVTDYRRRWRLDDSIYGGLRSASGNYAGIGCFRSWGSRPFSEEDGALIEAFAAGCSGLVFAEHDPVRLSRRQSQTLQLLLTGDSAKQIAARLGLSIHTVIEYIQSVYRAYGVTTRAGLLVRVLKRPLPKK
jgi:DNA-binding CsgD family transcriptional regulator